MYIYYQKIDISGSVFRYDSSSSTEHIHVYIEDEGVKTWSNVLNFKADELRHPHYVCDGLKHLPDTD